MRSRSAALVGSLGTLAILAVAGLVYVRVTGLRASAQPSAGEAALARGVRRLAIPSADARRVNPVAASDAVLAEGLAHYADHCASCHAIDGSGNTELGRGLFPEGAGHAGRADAVDDRRRAVLRHRARHPVHRHAGVVHRHGSRRDGVLAARARHPSPAAADGRGAGENGNADAAVAGSRSSGDRRRGILERRRRAASVNPLITRSPS